MIFANMRKAVREPVLLNSWMRYQVARLFSETPTRVIRGVKIGGFTGFSEYHGFPSCLTDDESEVLRTLQLRVGDMVVDVGANLGLFSLYFARQHPSLDILAFEPHPKTFNALTANVLENGANIKCFNLAVGAKSGRVEFWAERKASAISRFSSHNSNSANGAADLIEVSSVSLDDFSREKNLPQVGLLKIDVEGHEPAVLKGAERLFRARKIDRVYIEICPSNSENLGLNPDCGAKLLEQFDFQLFKIGHHGRLRRVNATDAHRETLTNWLAIRSDIVCRSRAN